MKTGYEIKIIETQSDVIWEKQIHCAVIFFNIYFIILHDVVFLSFLLHIQFSWKQDNYISQIIFNFIYVCVLI